MESKVKLSRAKLLVLKAVMNFLETGEGEKLRERILVDYVTWSIREFVQRSFFWRTFFFRPRQKKGELRLEDRLRKELAELETRGDIQLIPQPNGILVAITPQGRFLAEGIEWEPKLLGSRTFGKSGVQIAAA